MEYLNAYELAELKLAGLPTTRQNIKALALREGWVARKRSGKGGGIEFLVSSLPPEIQSALREREALALAEKAQAEAKAARVLSVREEESMAKRLAGLTDKQREAAGARLFIANYLKGLEASMGRVAAIQKFSEDSRRGLLPPEMQSALEKAVAKKRGDGVGVRTLHTWLIAADRSEGLVENTLNFAPISFGKPEKSLSSYFWLSDFLAIYQRFTGMPLAESYREFKLLFAAKYPRERLPSEFVVRRVLKRLPKMVRERGRVSGAKARAMETYVKRDWSVLGNNDVWVGDGHSLKMKVAHPEHGQPFTPELTLIMDAASRYIVGWSLAYSENTFAVADALRNAMINHGIPALYYSDNGAGQTSKILDADLSGIFSRLGIHHETGIPGNPQGRGIIERVMQTLAYPIARRFQTYYGTGADRDAVRQIQSASASLSKALAERQTELTPKQQSALGKLPTWRELLTVIEESVDNYNFQHQHSELKCTPHQRREMLKAQGAEVVKLTKLEADELFRPSFVRVVRRGWLQLFNAYYWAQALEHFDEQEVLVLADQHDPSAVLVRDMSGKLIGEAKLDGNKRDAFPKSLVEQSREGRAKRRLQRLEEEAAKARAELKPALEHEKSQTVAELLPPAFDLEQGALLEKEKVKIKEEIKLFESD